MWARSITGALVNLDQCALVATIQDEHETPVYRVVAFENSHGERTAVLYMGTAAQCLSYLDDLAIKLSAPGAQERIATALETLASVVGVARAKGYSFINIWDNSRE